MNGYVFKPRPEAVWFVLVAVLTVLMQALAEFDPEAITDWRAWAIGIGAAMVRALGAAVLVLLGKGEIAKGD
ncbi:MAG: hypothetical protein DIU79_12290 [Actinobacteria bacterium]|nr:MAG: hypothetical protein DIU79_12290 [Actinomycetota bacterium]